MAENKDNQKAENKDNQKAENKDNQKAENKDNQKADVIYPKSPKPKGYKTVVKRFHGENINKSGKLFASYVKPEIAELMKKTKEKGESLAASDLISIE